MSDGGERMRQWDDIHVTGKQKRRLWGAGGSQEEGGVGEMALWLRILAPLPGDSGSTPSICRVAPGPPLLPFWPPPALGMPVMYKHP